MKKVSNNMDEFSELEKKVYDALIDKKQNEVFDQVQSIQELLSKSRKYSISLPDSNEILDEYQKLNQQKIIKMNWARTMNKKIIYSLGAAALILIGLLLFINKGDKPKVQLAIGELRAKVTFVAGDVKIKSVPSEAGKKTELGAFLSSNQILVTGDKSTVDLEFSHGSSLRIKANTEIAMKRLIENNGNITEEVSLKKGMLVANVTKQKQSDNFNIVTPTVIAGVRGTRFLVVVDTSTSKDEVTRVSVLEGSVGITRHKNDVPITVEPVEIINSKEAAQELSAGGILKKSTISNPDVKIIEGKESEDGSATQETEQSLFAKYGRLEVLSLDGGKSVTGVVTSMDENTLTVHTVNGFVKVDRKKVISSDAKQLK
jgi:hypothetical protein